MKTLFQKLLAWIRWHQQPSGKFIHLKPGADLASVVLRHREEIEKQVEAEKKFREMT